MGRHVEKGERFEFLINQIDKALTNMYYVEALSIAYALFEERTYQLLSLFQIPYNPKRDKLYSCLNKFEETILNSNIGVSSERLSQNGLIDYLKDQFLSSNLVQDIQNWRDQRNDIIHDLAKEKIDYNKLSSSAQAGRDLLRDYLSVIIRVKKLCKR